MRENIMTITEWKTCMNELIGGVEQGLHSTATLKTKRILATLKRRLPREAALGKRKVFERDLEDFMQGTKDVHNAAQAYIARILAPVLAPAALLSAQARFLLTTYDKKPNKKGGSKPHAVAGGRRSIRSQRNRKLVIAVSRRTR